MKRLVWIFAALGTLLLQVQPVRATLRMPASTTDCCRAASSCCQHPAAPAANQADDDCSACVPCCAGCAILPVSDVFEGSPLLASRLESHHERSEQRRDPPPLPPPRRPA